MKNLFDEAEDSSTLGGDEHLKSLRQIEDMTGFGFRKIQKRIRSLKPAHIEGPAHYYDTRQVLPLLYTQSKQQQDAHILDQERARLAAMQADRTELIVQRMKTELVPIAEVKPALDKVFGAIRAKCLAMPSKVAPQLSGLEPLDIEYIMKDAVYELLTELSNLDIAKCVATDDPSLYQSTEATAEV